MRVQLREIGSGSGRGAQNSLIAHFGLARAERADLRIEWPSGIVQEFHDVAGNRHLTITEPPALEAVGMVPGLGFEMTLTSRAGFSYAIEQTSDFQTWNHAKDVHAVNGAVQVVVGQDPPSSPYSFYQAMEIPTASPGLAAWWAAEGNALDEQFRFHAEAQGGVAYEDGVLGQAFSFDAFGEWVHTAAPVLTKVDDWTVELWAYLRGSLGSAHQYQVLLYNGLSGGNGYGMYLPGPAACAKEPWYCNKEGMLLILYGGVQSIPSGYFPPENTWVHLALTRSAGLLRLYADGRLVFATPTDDPKAASGTTHLSGDASSSFNGLIDEARVWNRALSGTEVRDIHRVGALQLAVP